MGAPFALALSLLAALLVFLFDICAVLLTIASVILAVLGVALFFTPTPIGWIVFLFLASAIVSPSPAWRCNKVVVAKNHSSFPWKGAAHSDRPDFGPVWPEAA